MNEQTYEDDLIHCVQCHTICFMTHDCIPDLEASPCNLCEETFEIDE